MYDFRTEILGIAEKALHIFVSLRLQDMGIEDSWKAGLFDFVIQEYEIKKTNKGNYEQVYCYLKEHELSDFSLDMLDITALYALINYYPKSQGIYNVSPDAFLMFKNQIQDIKELRNKVLAHQPQNMTAEQSSRMYFTQLWAIDRIKCFASLVMQYKGPSDEWIIIYHSAKTIEAKLQAERWLMTSETKTSVFTIEEDFCEINALAEAGNSEAQVRIGKAHFHGIRVKRDYEKAYSWFRKAAYMNNAEAEYYLGLCYGVGKGVDQDFDFERKWLLKSAEHGFADAQYRYASNLFGNNSRDDHAEEIVSYLRLSAAQSHPEACWLLGICFACGIGVEKDQSEYERLAKISSDLGYATASRHFGDAALKEKRIDEAIIWYKKAATQGDKSANSTVERLERKS